MNRILRMMIFLLLPGCMYEPMTVPLMQKIATGKEHVIDVYAAYQQRDSVLRASELVEDIEFIPLETTDECLLGESLPDMVMTQTDIWVFDYHKAYRFNRKGKFLNSVGSQGEEPGQYIKPLSMTVDTLNRWVYIGDIRRDQLVKYDYEGRYLGDVKFGIPAYSGLLFRPQEFIAANDAYQFAPKGEKYSLYYYSEKENRFLSKLKCEHEKIPRLSICHPIAYKYGEDAYLKDYWCDTLYRMKDPVRLESVAVFHKGEWGFRRWDDQSLIYPVENPEDPSILDLSRIAETNRFIFAVSNKGSIVYDKRTCTTLVADIRSDDRVAIQDDLYGSSGVKGVDFPKIIHPNTMVAFASSPELIASLKSPHLITDQRYDVFQKKMQNLKEGDNPVIMLLKIKE